MMNPILSQVPTTFDLETFDYSLPDDLIAQNPLPNRDDSRLLVRTTTGELRSAQFCELHHILPKGALLVVNSSKVFPCRVIGKFETGGRFEIFLLECRRSNAGMSDWSAIGMPLKKIRRGKILNCGRGLTVHHLEDLDEQTVIVRFNADRESVLKWLYEYGKVPLPPYIHRSDEQEPERRTEDLNRYQTIYANSIGSVAAPTAGLHFTAAIMSKLQEFQVNVVDVMLHVGAGTFLPVKSRDVRNHQMHFETYCIPQGSYQAICSAREKMQPIIAVGTTTFRCLESFFDDCTSGMKAPEQFYSTNLFIRPSEAGKRCRPVSGITGLITNFHQPKSTLFMLVCALIGIDSARAAYAYAVEQRYRFLSYGDACYFQL